MFASFCLSHLIAPSSFPPRKPVKSAAWGLEAKILWGISKVCSFSVCYCMTLFEANHIELPEEKEEEREEGKKYTNLNDFLK